MELFRICPFSKWAKIWKQNYLILHKELLRLKLWAFEKVRPVLFDVKISFGQWKHKKNYIWLFSYMLDCLLQTCGFNIRNGSNESKLKTCSLYSFIGQNTIPFQDPKFYWNPKCNSTEVLNVAVLVQLLLVTSCYARIFCQNFS